MNMNENNRLEMRFDPHVIEHLGVRMYSTLPPVLSELIANAYDADAKNVLVELHDKGKHKDNKKIIVKDDGIGMSFEDIQDKFLRIGRNRRKDGDERTPGNRKPIGKKGLGKLSFFGIVPTITVNTVRENKRNIFVLDWEKLMSTDGVYSVDLRMHNGPTEDENGTTVELTNIKRKGPFLAMDLAKSISRFFIFEEEFDVAISHNNESHIQVTNQMRFDSVDEQFKWNIPDAVQGTTEHAYLKEHGIHGEIITYKSSASSREVPRGVVLFSRQKLVQEPSHFAKSTSSYFFSYLSGWLAVDFIDNLDEDVIATNRQNLNWVHPDLHKLEDVLIACIDRIQKEWREKRDELKKEKIRGQLDDSWYESMPPKMRKSVKALVAKIADAASAEEGDLTKVVDSLLKVIPHYPYYHWRNLHKSLKKPLLERYQKGDYPGAALAAVQIYTKAVQKKSRLTTDGYSLFDNAFGADKLLEIQTPFNEVTHANVQRGQQSLSKGLSQSFRNPSAHYFDDPAFHDFFIDGDLLDVLSLISFLLRRVDKAKKVKPAKKPQTSKKAKKKK